MSKIIDTDNIQLYLGDMFDANKNQTHSAIISWNLSFFNWPSLTSLNG